ncbi:tyrosine-type recombinase/integrase [Demequina aurantiaca]|uniref:tyrosine-type recombinase/integrase n=1 Tax=Demequina aurantiaca TaxID=676200 RepID=UPI003D32DED8
MASITKTERTRIVKDKNGRKLLDGEGRIRRVGTGTYYHLLTYREEKGSRKEVKRRFKSKAEAEQALKNSIRDQATNTYVSPGHGKVTVREFVYSTWLPARALKRPSKGTTDLVDRHLRNHILPAFGETRLDQVRPLDCSDFIARLLDTHEASTVKLIHVYAKSIFTAAEKKRLIRESPFAEITAPVIHKKKLRLPSTTKIVALADAMPARYRALIICAATTGLRQGELFGLTWDRIFQEDKELEVDKQLVGIVNGMPVFGPLKTAASYRTIPLPQVALAALADHGSSWPAGPEGLVFTNVHNGPLTRQNLEPLFNAALAAIEPDTPASTSADRKKTKSTTFHTLRHYYASLLIQSGESVKAVQELLGHASAVETLDTYGHLWPGADERVRSAVDKEFDNLQ